MKILCITIFLLSSITISAQGAFKKSSKDNDYLVVVNDGIQFNVGVSYLISSKELNGELSSGTGRGVYQVTPEGKLGYFACLLYTSPSPRDGLLSRMPSSA